MTCDPEVSYCSTGDSLMACSAVFSAVEVVLQSHCCRVRLARLSLLDGCVARDGWRVVFVSS